MNEAVNTALAGITIALLAGAVVGRLYPTDTRAGPVGDRVFCGLLALPLIAVLTHQVFPEAHTAWKLLAPTPVAIYALLLAGTDWKLPFVKENFVKDHFTLLLVTSIAAVYGIAAVILAYGGT